MSRNCREKCRYARFCKERGVERDDFPDECVMFYKIDDLLMEADDIRREQERERGEEDGW